MTPAPEEPTMPTPTNLTELSALQTARAAALTPELVEQLHSLLGPALAIGADTEGELAPAALLGEMIAYVTDLRAENALLEAEVERLQQEVCA